jgi:hypothetical protein
MARQRDSSQPDTSPHPLVQHQADPGQAGPAPPAGAVASEEFPAVGTQAWGRMNQRRAELIRKKNREGLTEAERQEYDRLQALSHAALEKAYPRPALDTEGLARPRENLRTESEKE